jgi:hypothetical protein
VLDPGLVFNPGSPDVAARLIAEELLRRPRQALATLPPFYGSGPVQGHLCGRIVADKEGFTSQRGTITHKWAQVSGLPNYFSKSTFKV